MHQPYLPLVFLVFAVSGDSKNDLVFDYFNYKQASSVVGFSCDNVEEDLLMIKRFNEAGITCSLSKLSYDNKINEIAISHYHKIGVFLDIRCNDNEYIQFIFSEATYYRMYDELHYWLILSSSVEEAIDLLYDESFTLSTDLVVAVPSNETDDFYYLYDIYNPWKDHGAQLNETFLGYWSTENLTIILTEEKYFRRSDLLGLTVNAIFYYSKYKPYNMSLEHYLQDCGHPTRDSLSKFGFIMVHHLSEMFNFKLNSSVAPIWQVGDAIGPVVRALSKNEVDITGTPTTMNVHRTHLVKYLHQSWPFRTCFIFRSPQPKYIKFDELLAPFDKKVWCLVGATLILSGCVLAVLFIYEHSDSHNLRWSNAALVVFAALCQQSTDVKMQFCSTRIAFLHVITFCILICTYYSAGIVSARLNAPVYKINDSLSQLARTDLQFASEWMVYFELFIKKKDSEIVEFYTKKWQQIPESEKFMDPEAALRLVQKGGFAYHMHPDVGYPLVNRWYSNHDICELTEIHLAKPTYSTFGVTLNSTLIEIVRIGLTKIDEVGIRQRQVTRWTSRKPRCMKNVLSVSSVTMYEFAPLLVILLFGIILSGMIYTFEVLEMDDEADNKYIQILKFILRDFLK